MGPLSTPKLFKKETHTPLASELARSCFRVQIARDPGGRLRRRAEPAGAGPRGVRAVGAVHQRRGRGRHGAAHGSRGGRGTGGCRAMPRNHIKFNVALEVEQITRTFLLLLHL